MVGHVDLGIGVTADVVGQSAPSGRDCCVRGWEQRLPCLMHESRALYRLAHRDLGVRRVSVPAGGDHLGGAVIPALRTFLP
jgi:hypothetical protein